MAGLYIHQMNPNGVVYGKRLCAGAIINAHAKMLNTENSELIPSFLFFGYTECGSFT